MSPQKTLFEKVFWKSFFCRRGVYKITLNKGAYYKAPHASPLAEQLPKKRRLGVPSIWSNFGTYYNDAVRLGILQWWCADLVVGSIPASVFLRLFFFYSIFAVFVTVLLYILVQYAEVLCVHTEPVCTVVNILQRLYCRQRRLASFWPRRLRGKASGVLDAGRLFCRFLA